MKAVEKPELSCLPQLKPTLYVLPLNLNQKMLKPVVQPLQVRTTRMDNTLFRPTTVRASPQVELVQVVQNRAKQKPLLHQLRLLRQRNILQYLG